MNYENICWHYINYEKLNVYSQYLNYEIFVGITLIMKKLKCLFAIHELWKQENICITWIMKTLKCLFAVHELWKIVVAMHELWKCPFETHELWNRKISVCKHMIYDNI